MIDNSSIVSLRDINVRFNGSSGQELLVLDDIDLDVSFKEFVSILGPSGCGKSTLLRVIAGLLQPTFGSCKVNTQFAAFNFQKPTLLPWLTVHENALLPFKLSDTKPSAEHFERLKTLLGLTKLEPFEFTLPSELSGGMQMRAALVRTLMTKPKLILMDEPFAAIDELSRLWLGLEFRALARHYQAAVVFITHSVQEAALLSDRIVVMSPRPAKVVKIFQNTRCGEIGESDLVSPQYLELTQEIRKTLAHE